MDKQLVLNKNSISGIVIRTKNSIIEKQKTSSTLFGSLYQARSCLKNVVHKWIEIYLKDEETAIFDLLQVFVQASGCKGKITPYMVSTMDYSQIILTLGDEFDTDFNFTQIKKFYTNFCEFIDILVIQCHCFIIYNKKLRENLLSLLIAMSKSYQISFRQSSTLAAVKIITSLISILISKKFSIKNEISLNTIRTVKIFDNLHELEAIVYDIKVFIDFLFISIFANRYKDTLPEIRAICITEIGLWMKRLPSFFLNDSYLKYFGYILHDNDSNVKLQCLKSLVPLYECKQNTLKMNLFTKEFKTRLIAMSLEKDEKISFQAIKLIINIHKHHCEILPFKEFEYLCEMVQSTNGY